MYALKGATHTKGLNSRRWNRWVKTESTLKNHISILHFSSSNPPRKRQKRDSGSINEPEVAIKDFAKNLKDESDITVSVSSQQTQNAPKQEPQHELLDENSGNSNASSMPDQKSGNINAGSFLGMAAASLMDPSAAKGTFF